MGRRGGPPSNGRTECLHFIIDDEQLGAQYAVLPNPGGGVDWMALQKVWERGFNRAPERCKEVSYMPVGRRRLERVSRGRRNIFMTPPCAR
jgi:hypothetical protein